jgi:glycerol-3-phosphate dehydrogenase (NAD(P)+)
MSRIAILGAGALGTALSMALHKRDRSIHMWSVEPDVVSSLQKRHENAKYLPGFLISPSVHVTLEIQEALEDAEAVVLAVPSFAMREVARVLMRHIPENALIVSATKGLEEGTWHRMSEVIEQETPPDLPISVAAMSGPCLAPELAGGSAAALDVASVALDAARRARQLLATHSFRMKPTNDINGVEAGGALQMAYAVGAGIGDGLGWGMNERAAYISKALAEIARIASALGAKRPTLYGLSGLGDLTATAFSPHSRNRMLGEELARGRSLRDAQAGLVSVVEGINTSRAAHTIATDYHLRLPISEALFQVLHEGEEPSLIQKALTSAR